MDADRFDAAVRSLNVPSARRTILGLTLGGLFVALGLDAEAKKKRKKKKRKCKASCDGKECGSDGCKGACGSCVGGECQDGQCVCPVGGTCTPGVCCPNEQICQGGVCEACPVGVTPCEVTILCGRTAGDKPCACATTSEGDPACVQASFDAITCFACETDAECETELGLPPGEAVCLGGLGCLCDEPVDTGCARKGCVDL